MGAGQTASLFPSSEGSLCFPVVVDFMFVSLRGGCHDCLSLCVSLCFCVFPVMVGVISVFLHYESGASGEPGGSLLFRCFRIGSIT